MTEIRALLPLFRRASAEWVKDNAPRLAAAVAFYVLLSLAPVVVIAIAVAGMVYGPEAARGLLASEIQGMAGPYVARTIQEIARSAYQPRTGAIATVLGLATLSFSASSIFVELHDAMNTIWDVPSPVNRSHSATIVHLIVDRFYSFAVVLGIGLLLLISLVWNAWTVAMRINVPRAATLLVLYLLIAALFAALYRVLPDVPVTWSDVASGALLTSLLFLIGTQLMGLYFAHAAFGSTYSSIGAPIVVLLWIYYSAQLFFWGAEFSKVYQETLGSQSKLAKRSRT